MRILVANMQRLSPAAVVQRISGWRAAQREDSGICSKAPESEQTHHDADEQRQLISAGKQSQLRKSRSRNHGASGFAERACGAQLDLVMKPNGHGLVRFACRVRACKLSTGLPWDAESSAAALAFACSCIALPEVLQASHRPACFCERRKRSARGASKPNLLRHASSSLFAKSSRNSSMCAVLSWLLMVTIRKNLRGACLRTSRRAWQPMTQCQADSCNPQTSFAREGSSKIPASRV